MHQLCARRRNIELHTGFGNGVHANKLNAICRPGGTTRRWRIRSGQILTRLSRLVTPSNSLRRTSCFGKATLRKSAMSTGAGAMNGLHGRRLRLEGFEPPTDGLEIRCSIQLSYRRLWAISISMNGMTCKLSGFRNPMWIHEKGIAPSQIVIAIT